MDEKSVFLKIPYTFWKVEGKHFFVLEDRYPVSKGHCIIISKNERDNFFSLNPEELRELPEMIVKSKNYIESSLKPDGYNIGMNCGISAGQTVMHFHCHVIPRYSGDMEDPRGGVRHCIKGKGYY